MMFAAVNQLNMGGPSVVSDSAEFFMFANHNLVAGQLAMEMSEFSSAHNLFINGINFLRWSGNHWQNHYKFSLEIFELAVKTALASGHFQRIQVLSEEVVRHARCFEDKINVQSVIITSFAYAFKVDEALNLGLSILEKLLDDGISLCDLDNHIERINGTVKVENLSSHRLMTDAKQQKAMQILEQIHLVTVAGNVAVHPFLVIKMVDISVAHGTLFRTSFLLQ